MLAKKFFRGFYIDIGTKKDKYMQINLLDSMTFNGFYKLPNTQINAEKLVNKIQLNPGELSMEQIAEKLLKEPDIPEIAKVYKMLRNGDMFAFIGGTPFAHICWNSLLQNVAKSNSSDINWLKMNAQNYGIDASRFPGDEYIHVITTKNDMVDCLSYLRNTILRLLPTPLNSIRTFFDRQKISRNIDAELPEHLKIIAGAKNFLELENQAFANKVLKGKVKEVEDTNRLLNCMMSE